jgi:hypothetical protein
MATGIRRVVMGEPAPGKSAFTHIEQVEPLDPGLGFLQYHVWGWDATPALPSHDPAPYVPRSHFPPPGGVRITANLFQADRTIDAAGAPAPPDRAEFERLLTSLPVGRSDGPAPGIHQTDTIDIGVVISGEVVVEAEDGSTVTLRQGDVYVQNGAPHAWRPVPENPALVVIIILPAVRSAPGTQ